MVDHRADADDGYELFRQEEPDRVGWPQPTWRERLNDWLAARPRLFAGRGGAWTAYRVPILLSILWLALMVAYSIGYLGVFSAAGAPAGSKVELVFFVVALTGPLAVLWIAAVMIRRAGQLSEAIVGQSDTALALAATISNLQESVDDLGDQVSERLNRSLEGLETRVATSLSVLDDSVKIALDDTRVALAMRGAEMDKMLAETTARAERSIGEQISGLDRHLATGAEKLDELSVAQHELIAARLEESARSVESALGQSADALGARLLEADRKVAEGIERRAGELEKAIRATHEAQSARLEGASRQLESAVATLSERMTTAITARADAIDRTLAEESDRLGQAMQATARVVDGDLRQMLDDVRTSLEATRQTIAANPPATAEALGELLGTAAVDLVGPERKALAESVKRMDGLEEQARAILARIDRTARLSVPRPAAGQETRVLQPVALPFADLPEQPVLAEVNWPAVAAALDLSAGAGDITLVESRRLVSQDSQIAQVLYQADRVVAGLVEEEIFVEDLAAEPAPVTAWIAFAAGQRGAAVAPLAGIDDAAAAALLRARLRRDAVYQDLSLRFVAAFGAMVARAVAALGADAQLLEIADSRAGRAFQLLIAVTGALRPVPRPDEGDS